MFVYGANVPDGRANAASAPKPNEVNWRKTERCEKKKDGVTTNKPAPDELRSSEAATRTRFPRSSLNIDVLTGGRSNF